MTPDTLHPLEHWLADCWNELSCGVKSAKHPWHLGVLCTVNETGFPEGRTVVLRAAEQAVGQLVFHTDFRSPKCREIEHNKAVSLIFYNPAIALQLRVQAFAQIETGTVATKEIWNALPDRSLRSYATTQAPGTPLDGPGTDLPPTWEQGVPGRDAGGFTLKHFAVVRCEMITLDLLSLSATGHRRAKFQKQNAAWQGQWVTP